MVTNDGKPMTFPGLFFVELCGFTSIIGEMKRGDLVDRKPSTKFWSSRKIWSYLIGRIGSGIVRA